MKQTLNLKLSQQLTLTPQLKQSLKLLQLSSLDLEHEVQEALDTNPLLERYELEREDSESSSSTTTETDQHLSNSSPEGVPQTPSNNDSVDQTDYASQDLDENWPEVGNTSNLPLTNHVDRISHNSNPDSEFTQFVSTEETLFDHLYWQVQMTTLSDKDKLIARALLRSIDDDGYLNIDVSEVCKMLDPELEVEVDEVSAVLSLIKTLEPAGVGARNLSERLAMQLANLGDNSDVDTSTRRNAEKIVNDYLDLLATRNTTKLKKELSINDSELSESLLLIQTLNPRISNRFSNDNQDHIVPDLIINKLNDVWAVNLNPENQTKLRVNETYSTLLKSDIDQQGSDYIQKNLIEAKTFIKNIMSRYDTLLLVGKAIVERQQAFFEHGDQYMQPMVLQDIANELEMHESTISRATSGKYLLSPRGVVELKYFFSSAVSNTDGATSSSTAVRSLIKKMVASESKQKPLSDNKIAKELEQQGHIVARRTVAKYRESMHIAPSSQRKSLI